LAQASKKSSGNRATAPGQVIRHSREISFILLVVLAVYLAVALISFHPADPGWSQAVSTAAVRNSGGIAGAWIADFLLYVFGYGGYLFPLIFSFDGWSLLKSRQHPASFNYYQLGARAAGFLLLFIGCCGLLELYFAAGPALPAEIPGAGGVFGDAVSTVSLLAFGTLGSTLLMLALFLIGLTLYSGLSWLWLMDQTGKWTLLLYEQFVRSWQEARENIKSKRHKRARDTIIREQIEKVENRPPPRIEPIISELPRGERAEKEKQGPVFSRGTRSHVTPGRVETERFWRRGRSGCRQPGTGDYPFRTGTGPRRQGQPDQ